MTTREPTQNEATMPGFHSVTVTGDAAGNVVTTIDQPPKYPESVIALGQHMTAHPELPVPASVTWKWYDKSRHRFMPGLDMQLGTLKFLLAWAATLTDVSSQADRLPDGEVFGLVLGCLKGLRVRVWSGGLPGDAFPAGSGLHEWDVTTLLQEA